MELCRARHNHTIEIDDIQERLFPWIYRQTVKCKSKMYMKATSQEFGCDVELTCAKAKLLTPRKDRLSQSEEVYSNLVP